MAAFRLLAVALLRLRRRALPSEPGAHRGPWSGPPIRGALVGCVGRNKCVENMHCVCYCLHMDERLHPRLAKNLLRRILQEGVVTYAVPHALERLRQRKISMVDCENVMRGGVVEEPEWESGAWRYRIRTRRIALVVQFLSESEVLVVTAWRSG